MKTENKSVLNQEDDSVSLDKFYKISAKLGSSLDLQKTLALVSEGLLDITDFDYCNIYLIDPQDPNILLHKFTNDNKHYFKDEKVKLSSSTHLKKMIKDNKTTFYCGLESRDYVKPKLMKYLKDYNIHCSLHIPIQNVSISGCIILDKRGSNCGRHTDKLSKNVTILTNQASIAIDNAITHEILMNQRDRWYSIFNNTSDGIAVVSEDLKIVKANRSLEKLLSMDDIEIIGKNMKNIFFGKEGEIIADEVKKVFRNSQPMKEKKVVMLKTKYGFCWADLGITYFKNKEKLPRIILTFNDISKEKELDQTKTEFVSTISHELRTPLTVMKGFLSLILKEKDYGELNEKQRKFLYRAYDSTDRMVNLVEHILDVNRIAVGKADLKLEAVDIRKIYRIVRRDFTEKLKEKKIRMIEEKSSRLPKALIDKERTYQIISNLLDNAVKYSYPNSAIKVSFTKKDGKVIFTVRDSGVGISQTEQKRVFEKFSRVDNSLTLSASGFGLGLYIVRNLVKAHGGEIWIESEKGKGSTFFVSFQVAKKNLIKEKG